MLPPTPSATMLYQSPNACNVCHEDRNAAWSDEWVRKWKTRDYQAPVLQRAALIAAARESGIPQLGTSLVRSALAEAETRGWAEVLTATRHDNFRAQALFNKAGFIRHPKADADDLIAFRIELGGR